VDAHPLTESLEVGHQLPDAFRRNRDID
jgi:hypothetical protein